MRILFLKTEVAKIENFQYNAKARRNGFFGQNVGVALKWDAEFDTAEVKVKKAVLEDGDVLVSSGEDITFPQPAYIREYLQSEELEQEYRRESGAVGPFCPQKAGGWWRCTCGELNADSEETCFACGKEAGPLFDLLNAEALETNLAEYKEERARIEEEERIKQEEEERIAAEKRAVAKGALLKAHAGKRAAHERAVAKRLAANRLLRKRQSFKRLFFVFQAHPPPHGRA